MVWVRIVLCLALSLPLARAQESNASDFVATSEWQEIKPGQKVPSGLHYRINLQTGFKEAKLLEEENEKTSLLQLDDNKDDESDSKHVNNDVVVEEARLRLADALRNIPSEKFDDVSEEKWKEISSKFKSYKQIKADLKEIDLEMKTEIEIIKQLIENYLKYEGNDVSSVANKLTILEDLEYLSHSIDNSLYFIDAGGLESILIPNLNDSNVDIVTRTLKTLAVITSNNDEAKKLVMGRTNIANYLINILSKPLITHNQLSSALFAFGSLVRNNRLVSSEQLKKGMSVLIDIIASDKPKHISLSTKALVLLSDLLVGDEVRDQELLKFIESVKVCSQLETFLNRNRDGLIADITESEKTISSLDALKVTCFDVWSESPIFRHELLVMLNYYKAQLSENDEDLSFLYSIINEQLDGLLDHLYGHLEISQDDTVKLNDEL